MTDAEDDAGQQGLGSGLQWQPPPPPPIQGLDSVLEPGWAPARPHPKFTLVLTA